MLINVVPTMGGLIKSDVFCSLPNGIIYKITSDANDE